MGVALCYMNGILNVNKYSGKFNLLWYQYRYRNFSEDFKNLIESLLKYDENERITIKNLRKHKWYNKNIATKERVKKFMENLKSEAKRLLKLEEE